MKKLVKCSNKRYAIACIKIARFWRTKVESEKLTEKKHGSGLLMFFDDCFLKLLNLKITDIREENIKEIIIPKVGSIILNDSTIVKVKKSIYKEPLYGPFLLLNYLSLDFVDNCEIRTMTVEADRFEKVYDENILKVAKICFLTNGINEKMQNDEIVTIEGSVKRNQETKQIQFDHVDTSNIIKSYEVIYKELGGTIDYDSLEFHRMFRNTKGFIHAYYPVEDTSLS